MARESMNSPIAGDTTPSGTARPSKVSAGAPVRSSGTVPHHSTDPQRRVSCFPERPASQFQSSESEKERLCRPQ
jgi:hypothetical protein